MTRAERVARSARKCTRNHTPGGLVTRKRPIRTEGGSAERLALRAGVGGAVVRSI